MIRHLPGFPASLSGVFCKLERGATAPHRGASHGPKAPRLLLAAFVVVAWALAPAVGASPEEDLQKARTLFLAKKYQEAVPAFDRVITEHPGSKESISARLAKATCLERIGRDAESIAIREEVVRDYPGTEDAARALLRLGSYYESREERGRAAEYYRRVVAGSPAGSISAKMALSQLKTLDRYFISPLYDKLIWEIRVRFLDGLLHYKRDTPARFDLGVGLELGLTEYLVRLGALGLTLLLLAASRRFVRPAPTVDGVLSRRWTPRRVVVVLVPWWTWYLLLFVGSCVLASEFSATGSPRAALLRDGLDVGITLMSYAAFTAAVVWQESLSRLFAIPRTLLRRALVGLGLTVVALCSAGVLAGLAQHALRRVGVGGTVRLWIPPGLPPDTSWIWAIASYLLVAVAEESMFRGAAYQAFKSCTDPRISAVLASLLFALTHVRPLEQTIPLFVFGLALTWLLERSRSLTPCIVLHWLLNLLIFAGRAR
ncbi:MAG: CPBP family intramembrane metalloprotease [Acidobacteriia bacterium]|nr:CPBP family intramembrane metalloprotease [Terriglobia bacterium]